MAMLVKSWLLVAEGLGSWVIYLGAVQNLQQFPYKQNSSRDRGGKRSMIVTFAINFVIKVANIVILIVFIVDFSTEKKCILQLWLNNDKDDNFKILVFEF